MPPKTSRLPDAAAYRALLARAKTIVLRTIVPHPPEAVARYAGQVDLMNKVAGNARPEFSFLPSEKGGSVTRAVASKGGITISYDELPYEWSLSLWGRAENFSDKGPMAYTGFEQHFEAVPEGTLWTFYFRYAGRGLGLLSWLAARGLVGAINRAIRAISEGALSVAEDPLDVSPYLETEEATGVNRSDLLARLQGLHSNQRVAEHVADFLATAPEKFALRLRPLQVALRYNLPEIDTIEFFLRATRRGLFNLSWDLLCPSCRGDKARFGTLAELSQGAHCDYCNIDYGIDFATNVELTFRPVPGIRKLFGGSYCINSPGNTPFVSAQCNVWPDQKAENKFAFSEQRYQLRSPQFAGTREVQISDQAPVRTTINLSAELDGAPKAEPLVLHPRAELAIESGRDYMVTAKFFRETFRDHALTAARVTSMQEFRDQFGAEALSPELQIGVENLCFLFTDLKDSTPMYERLGDAPAFALVRDHFSILIEEVRRHEGAVVKTIGDAVMAVFTSDTSAIKAAVGIQQRIHAEHPSVSVKIGIHAGPCLAVNSNEKLDYFGTTVNRAARIQGMADGQDIVMSPELEQAANEPLPARFAREEFQATLKGISGDARLVRWRFQ